MLTLPAVYHTLILKFAPLFSKGVWSKGQVLLLGAILTTGKRTVTATLRVMGMSAERHFQNYHRVLSRDVWSSFAISRVLLGQLLKSFAPTGRVIVGLDETLERRWGKQIKARGVYYDAVRSSRGHVVKTSGLRWLSAMLLVPIPWAKRVWALPFLTVLAPSERYYKKKGRAHKKLTVWARQIVICLRRWLPTRSLVIVADSAFAVLDLLARVQRLKDAPCMITRLRLDAALYDPAPKRAPHQNGRPRVKGKRLPTLHAVLSDPNTLWKRVRIALWYGAKPRAMEVATGTAVWYSSGHPVVPIRWVLVRDPAGKFKSMALLSTDPSLKPKQILAWFILRWQLEVTFEEVRAHLGVETQRQWSDLAIARTTPALLGLFSLVTLLAHHSTARGKLPVRQAAWYSKPAPTFSDALALVRLRLWQQICFLDMPHATDTLKVPHAILQRFIDAICYST